MILILMIFDEVYFQRAIDSHLSPKLYVGNAIDETS